MPDWLYDMWTSDPWFTTDHVIRVAMAVVLGGLIGLEREFGDKPAGFRTIILICVGACVFTIVSEVAGGPDWNHTRIAAQIVSGIGFLGAGAILRDRVSVIGLTTAATIWSVAAVGMAVGFGYLKLALVGTGAILAALLVFDSFEKWIGRRRDVQDYYLAVANTPEAFEDLEAAFAKVGLRTKHRGCHEDGSDLVFHVVAMGAKVTHEKLRMQLAQSDKFTLRKGR